MRDDIIDMIDRARKNVRKNKQTIPHIYPQWQELQRAKENLLKAKQRLEAAKTAWNSLGAE